MIFCPASGLCASLSSGLSSELNRIKLPRPNGRLARKKNTDRPSFVAHSTPTPHRDEEDNETKKNRRQPRARTRQKPKKVGRRHTFTYYMSDEIKQNIPRSRAHLFRRIYLAPAPRKLTPTIRDSWAIAAIRRRDDATMIGGHHQHRQQDADAGRIHAFGILAIASTLTRGCWPGEAWGPRKKNANFSCVEMKRRTKFTQNWNRRSATQRSGGGE